MNTAPLSRIAAFFLPLAQEPANGLARSPLENVNAKPFKRYVHKGNGSIEVANIPEHARVLAERRKALSRAYDTQVSLADATLDQYRREAADRDKAAVRARDLAHVAALAEFEAEEQVLLAEFAQPVIAPKDAPSLGAEGVA